jgi:DNA modification methylase
MEIDLFGNEIIKDELLRDKFIEPPFSILDTKTGSWQKRKRLWKNKGIASELGRDVKVINNSFSGEKYGRKDMNETSIFDPALTELMYHWYCPDNGTILDPFAGGSVRGIVANYLGYNYTGIDIRQEQIDANRNNALDILPINNQPNWYVGDSNLKLDELQNNEYDFVFSCPPYADLEKYSELEGDISNMNYFEFLIAYDSIIKKTIKLLKKDHYACFVVGDIRDKKGFYRDFVSHTKQSFINAGALLYNEAILLQPLGTAMLRAGKIFLSGGKLTKVHENILIFKKI